MSKKAIKWMLKRYNGQPVNKSDVKFLIAAYEAGLREGKKETKAWKLSAETWKKSFSDLSRRLK